MQGIENVMPIKNAGIENGMPIKSAGNEKVMSIKSNDNKKEKLIPTFKDEDFIRGKVPMTKSSIRNLSIIKLGLSKGDVFFDVGSGTGSVAIQAASMDPSLKVFAIERKEDALTLIKANKEKFGVENVEIVSGEAPEALEILPSPDSVFIGGSGGNLKEIIKSILSKTENVRFVINAISLETITETMGVLKELEDGEFFSSEECLKGLNAEGLKDDNLNSNSLGANNLMLQDLEIEQVAVSRSSSLGGYHMMRGENPIYIISFTVFRGGSHE